MSDLGLMIGGVLVVGIPVLGWFLVPTLNDHLGRPLEEPDVPSVRRFGRWYGYLLRGRAVVALVLALFLAWMIALFVVVAPFVTH